MDNQQPSSSLSAADAAPLEHTQAEMIQFIDFVDQLAEDQKTYLMRVLFAEGTQPLSLDQMQKLSDDQFCLAWLEANTQFDYERFKATMQSLSAADEELQKGATSAILPEEDWENEEVQERLRSERDQMVEHYRQLHAEEIKQSRNDD